MDELDSEDFNKRKRKWLRKTVKYNENKPPKKASKEPSIKLSSLRVIFSNSSNSELLRIESLLQAEISSRSKEVEIFLKNWELDGDLFGIWGKDVYNEVHRLALQEAVKDEFRELTYDQQDELVEIGTNLLYFLKKNEVYSPLGHIYELEQTISSDKVKRYINKIESKTNIPDTKLKTYINIILNDYKRMALRDYFEDYPENKYIIQASKNIQESGKEVSRFMLYTIKVPLNGKYSIKSDKEYGQYPVIIDKSDNCVIKK